jgi:hypothetical protein
MNDADTPEVVQRIRDHGGLLRIHVTPFTNRERKVIGWQNVYVCKDGARFGLTPAEEEEAMSYSLDPE